MFEEEGEGKQKKVSGVEKGERNLLKRLLIKVIPYLIVAVLAGGGIFYIARTKPEIFGLPKGNAAEQAQAEVDALVAEVGKVMSLPSDEKPTVASVTDIEKVKDQPFFKNAQNGDKVLVYTNAKKAILYRPSDKRIIEVGAVSMGAQQPNPVVPTEVPSTTP
jgi:hypothetical protein